MTDAGKSLSLSERRTAARETQKRELLRAFPARELPHLSLRGILGVGGTATVYEAFHTRLSLPVAVKVLSVHDSIAEEARARMLREARLCASLGDPRIPRIYDADVLPDGRVYVVLEMLSGTSLRTVLESGRALLPELAVHIARELLEPLDYLHAAGVIHRDVKPENVLLDLQSTPPRVWLIDLGIAKSVATQSDDPVLTQQGTVLGTPHYMAPERLTGHEADERADIYAVGLLLHEMLTGTPTFVGDSPAAVMVAVLRDTPCDVRERLPGISPNLAGIVRRAVEREPADRFASARDMLKALSDENTLTLRPKAPAVLPSAAEEDDHEETSGHARNGRVLIFAAIGVAMAIAFSWTDDDHAHKSAASAAAPAASASLRHDSGRDYADTSGLRAAKVVSREGAPPAGLAQAAAGDTTPSDGAAQDLREHASSHSSHRRVREEERAREERQKYVANEAAREQRERQQREYIARQQQAGEGRRGADSTASARPPFYEGSSADADTSQREPAARTDLGLPRGLRNNPYASVPDNPYH